MAPPPGTIHRHRVGDVLVTVMSDGHVELPASILRGAPALPPDPLRIQVNAFLLQADGRTMLVDAGAGDTLGPLTGHLPMALQAAGVTAEAIDTVLLTHVHSDHANGLLDSAGALAFPRAEILVHEGELAHWLDDARLAAAPAASQPAFHRARRVLTACAGQIRPLGAGRLPPWVEAVPLPGHTPGHTGYRIASGGEQLLIWGDIMHVPAVQLPHPATGVVFDVDREMAVATRQRICGILAREGTPVAGMHLEFPALVTLHAADQRYAATALPGA